MNSYTFYWDNDTWKKYSREGDKRITYIAASNTNNFKDIRAGDEVFVVTAKDNILYVGGRLIADGSPIDRPEAESRLVGESIISRSHYVLARSDELCIFKGNISLKAEAARDLEVLLKDGSIGHKKFNPETFSMDFTNTQRISAKAADSLREKLGLEAAGSSGANVSGDFEVLYSDKTLDETTRKQLIDARVGQGRFRRNVIAVWGNGEQCAVTRISVRDVLVASHIRPWKSCSTHEERLAGTNGVLLAAHLDKLFDRFLISFDETGKIAISRRLTTRHRDELKTTGLNGNMELDFSQIRMVSKAEIEKMLREHHAELMRLDLNAG